MWTLSKDERRSAKASGEAEKATGRCFSIKSQVKSNGCATILFCRRQVKKNLIPKRQLSCHKKEQTPKDAKIGPNTFFPLNRVQSVGFCGNFLSRLYDFWCVQLFLCRQILQGRGNLSLLDWHLSVRRLYLPTFVCSCRFGVDGRGRWFGQVKMAVYAKYCSVVVKVAFVLKICLGCCWLLNSRNPSRFI